ncbi:PKD domain-containing protein [Flavobacterium sp. N3904]|uniref:PKD domain-containing protein n=1 Tax=Flavobacterium sp. N3904 TaxID=2986835 RepID=UPI00222477D5|nr:PKD domain-containing protein [Flavobacterium sp. N3904]
MKLKYTLVFSIISFFITTGVFSQELSDQEIGFDVTATSLMLKEHGVKDQDLAREITLQREMQLFQYVEMKKVENGILQKIMDEQSAQVSTSHVANTAKTTFVDIPLTERDALIAFYNSTGGPNWTNTQSNNRVWNITNPSSDVSTWYGVSVSNGHIVSLNLDRNNLKGKLSDLNALTFLNSLSLNGNYNNFVGNSMPSWFTTMIGLNVLSIQGYGFTGPIQDLSALINLQYLDLMDNNFGGGTATMPSWLTGMVSLRNLSLVRCKFIGPLPNLSTLTNLEYLALAGNTFGATMPSWFNTMLSLRYLFLSNCNFTGKIPDLSPLTNLLYLELGNDFTFDIQPMPSWISKIVTLQSLFIGYCNLTGPIADLSRLTNLKFLTLSGNNFNSIIPSELYNLKKLENISLNSCNLKGEISVNIGNLTMLRYLAIYNNNLEGSVPLEINKLKNLNGFYLQNNKLSGVIPNFTALPLQQFMINDNKFRFLDFVNEFLAYKVKMPNTNNNPFYYSPQAKINTLETITKPSGQPVDLKMYAEGDTRYLSDDTYQWFKNGTAIAGATSRIYTIPSLLATDAATYLCRSYHASNPDMSPLVLEREPITLKVINCTPVAGTLKASAESPPVNASAIFSLETATTGLTYKWTFYDDTSGTIVKDGTQTAATASQSYSVPGSYLVRLEVTEANGCTTKFDKIVNVINSCVDSYSPNRNGSIKSPYPYGDYSGVILNKLTNLSFYSSSGSTSLSYQWNLLDSNNLVIASGNQAIFPITLTLAGDYKVTLRVSDATGCSSFVKNLKTRDANACIVPIDERNGYISDVNNSNKLLVNSATSIALVPSGYTPSGFTYKWDFVKLNGEIVLSGNQDTFSVTPNEIGDYKINLQIKDPNGCTTDYTRDYKVMDICSFSADDEQFSITTSDEYNLSNTYFVQINESKDFSANEYSGANIDNFTFKWSLLNPSGELVSTSTNDTFSAAFTIPGYYRIALELINKITGCKRLSAKEVGCLIGNSCTELNPKSVVVKDLLKNLIKKLLTRTIKGETDAQINASPTSPEFLALKQYITKGVGDNIYNYKYSKNEVSSVRPYAETIDFSFSPDRLSDIHLDFYWGISSYATYELSDEELSNRLDYDVFIDLTQYISSNDYLISCRVDMGGKNAQSAVRPNECREESEVRYIDFCPTDCTLAEGALKSTPQVLNANVNASFSLETVATNLTYDWTFYNLDNTTALAKATTALATQSFTAAGRYRVVLKVKDDKGCETPFETFTTVLPACTPITGVIKMSSGVTPTPTPNPTPVPTQSYWYQAVHPINHSGTDYVVYIDGNGIKQTYTLTRTESGDNAPCAEIIASSIVNHSGAVPCVLSCNEYEIAGGTNGRTVSFTNCDGMSQTVIVPAGDSLPVCSRMVIGGATLIGPCDAGSVVTPTPTPTPTPAPTALIGFSKVGVSESFPGNLYPNGGNFLYAIGHADIQLDGLGIVKGDSVTIEFQYYSSFTPTHYYNISYPGINSAFVPLPLYTPTRITIVYNGIDKTIGINLLSPFSQFLKSNKSGTASLSIVSVNGASMQIDTNNNSLQLISPATAGIGVTFKK